MSSGARWIVRSFRVATFWFAFGGAVVLITQMIAVHAKWLVTGDHCCMWEAKAHFEDSSRLSLESCQPQIRWGMTDRFFYAIARDPAAVNGMPERMPAFYQARYRYRRILFPLLAGGCGQFSRSNDVVGDDRLDRSSARDWRRRPQRTSVSSGGSGAGTVLLALLNPGTLLAALLTHRGCIGARTGIDRRGAREPRH